MNRVATGNYLVPYDQTAYVSLGPVAYPLNDGDVATKKYVDDNGGVSPTYQGQNTIVTVGTITSGTWNGTKIAAAYGGLGDLSGPGLVKVTSGVASVAAAGSDYLYPTGGAQITSGSLLKSAGATVAAAVAGVDFARAWSGVQVVYVGKHGNLANDGTSESQAVPTFASAIALCSSASSTTPYNIVCLDGGVYVETVPLILQNYTSITAPRATISATTAADPFLSFGSFSRVILGSWSNDAGIYPAAGAYVRFPTTAAGVHPAIAFKCGTINNLMLKVAYTVGQSSLVDSFRVEADSASISYLEAGIAGLKFVMGTLTVNSGCTFTSLMGQEGGDLSAVDFSEIAQVSGPDPILKPDSSTYLSPDAVTTPGFRIIPALTANREMTIMTNGGTYTIPLLGGPRYIYYMYPNYNNTIIPPIFNWTMPGTVYHVICWDPSTIGGQSVAIRSGKTNFLVGAVSNGHIGRITMGAGQPAINGTYLQLTKWDRFSVENGTMNFADV